MQNVGKWNRIDDIEKTQNIQVNQKDRKGRKMESQSSEIIIIGAAIIDILVRPADEEVFRSGSSSAEEIRMSTGADALNEATVLARLGKRVRLETVIGSDRAGAFIREHCQNSGIELPEDCEREGLPTGINVVLIDKTGERHFLTNPKGSLRSLTLADIHMPFCEDAGIVCFASIFVVSRISADKLEIIFRQAKKQGKIVCADMTKRKKNETVKDIAAALQYVDYLLPNAEEAMLLTGEETVEEAADSLAEAGAGNVVIKCGRKGCYLKSGQKSEWVPAVNGVRCVDTTGAGDSFAAGFVYALSEGKSLRECAEYANQCGAKAVGSVGAVEWTEQI